MDDYYCLWSVLIPNDTEEERDWLVHELEHAKTGTCEIWGRTWSDDSCACAGVSPRDPVGVSFRDRRLCAELCGRAAIWVYAEAYVFGDALANVVARFQTHFAKADFWECHCASTCSTLQLDAYGGYGILVHQGEIQWFILGNDIPDPITEPSNLHDFARTFPPSW
jgi:hypothetical protein